MEPWALFAVREFRVTDVDEIVTLLYETVHAINAHHEGTVGCVGSDALSR